MMVGKILATFGQTNMGHLILLDGTEIYFDSRFLGTKYLKIGDFVQILEVKQIRAGIIRPTRYEHLTPTEFIQAKMNKLFSK